MFTKEDRVLLIGDSITDSGRREDREEIGDGYLNPLIQPLMLIYGWFLSKSRQLKTKGGLSLS